MTIEYNETFRQLLTEYNLTEDLSFSIEIPNEIQSILDDEIVLTNLGITFQSSNRLYKVKESWENQSIIEDNENHFHVEGYIDPPDNRKAFMLGIKTLMLLANRFQKENVNGVRFWYSFQTPELGKLWAKSNGIDEDTDEHFISDRLSFYTRRNGDNVITLNRQEESFWAMMTIDI